MVSIYIFLSHTYFYSRLRIPRFTLFLRAVLCVLCVLFLPTDHPRTASDPDLALQHDLEAQEGRGGLWASLGGSVGGVVGGLLGGMGVVMLLLTIVVVMVRQRRQRSLETGTAGGGGGGGKGTGGPSLDPASRSFQHVPHSTSHSSLNVDPRDSGESKGVEWSG